MFRILWFIHSGRTDNRGSIIVRSKKRKLENANLEGFLFVLPWIIGFLLFKLYPILLSGYYSFTNFSAIKKPVWIVTATMLIPFTVIMIPLYRMWSQLRLVGTFWPLIIPSFFGNSFYVILLRQFMLTLPGDLLEAAKIDGCNAFQRYTRLVLPLTKPGMATIIIFSFMYSFSDFLGPLLYANNANHYTLSLGLHAFQGEHYVDWTGLMAATTLFIIPIMIVFLITQRQFVEGIATSGLKG
jgi:ABC-type glycerol-3-phosphate transport system permease component